MPGALQHTSISVQISTFFCQEGWGSRGGSGLGGEYGECEWPVIHISLILDFPIDLLKLGDCVLQAQVGRMFAWNQRWFQAKVFGHILLFNLVSFFVFSFVQPDDIIVLGDADLFVVTSPSWFEFVPLKHLFASHQIGSASSPFLFIINQIGDDVLNMLREPSKVWIGEYEPCFLFSKTDLNASVLLMC